MENDPKFWNDLALYGSLLLVAIVAVLLYLCLISSIYMRSRMSVDLYLEVGRQVQRLEELKRTGGEAPSLGPFLELQSNLRAFLEEEGVLRKPEKSGTREQGTGSGK